MSRKNRIRIRNVPQSIISGCVTGILVLVILFCILATIMTKYNIPGSSLIYFYFAFALISGLITGVFTGRFTKSKAIIWSSLSAGITAVIFLLFLLIYNGFIVNPLILIVVPMFILSGGIGGVISANFR